MNCCGRVWCWPWWVHILYVCVAAYLPSSGRFEFGEKSNFYFGRGDYRCSESTEKEGLSPVKEQERILLAEGGEVRAY